jgi:hypothetical protein
VKNYKWTSVEEELPQEYINVLCYGPNIGLLMAYYSSYKDGGGSWLGDDSEVWYSIQDITHWIFIPEPPNY